MKPIALIFLLFFCYCEASNFRTLECEEMQYKGENVVYGSGVKCTLENGITLTCRHAAVDKNLTQGTFSGGATLEGVISSNVPFFLKANRVEADRNDAIVSLQAHDDVMVECDDAYEISSDRMDVVFKNQDPSTSVIHLYAESPLRPCEMRHENGDVVQGLQASVDVPAKKLTIEKAHGLIQIREGHHEKVEFSSNTLDYQQDSGVIYLNDEVIIRCKGIGVMCSDKAALYTDKDSGKPYQLKLKGNVRVCNHFAESSEVGTPLDQYALADSLQYEIASKQMVLTAKKGRRVLFYDKANHVKVSAPKVLRDGEGKVKGFGDVKCTFAEQELQELRKQFPL